MHVIVGITSHFLRTPDGKIWTHTMFPYSFWCRYLEVFEAVKVVARVKEVPAVPGDWHRVDGEKVSFSPVPDFQGPWQLLFKARQVWQAVGKALKGAEAVILRLVCPVCTCMEKQLARTGHPYGVEVVGDPYGSFSPGAIKHLMRPIFRWWLTRTLQRQCQEACAAAYVTQGALQRRYPPAPKVYSTYYSSVELPGDSFVTAPRKAERFRKPATLVTVGSLSHYHKAPDILIMAVHACVQEGLDLRLVLVGDGKERRALEAMVAERGLKERVVFAGQLPAGEAVRARLDEADLFVLPSRTEGLPRAMIEAMARALPCIGSTAGGIPELLPPEDMVPPNEVGALAQKVREVLADPGRMQRMSARNLEQSRGYQEEILRGRRASFYQAVHRKTQEWLRAKTAWALVLFLSCWPALTPLWDWMY
jgi:glycosyltransferase involved in cell wall biosynthesis